MAPSHAAHPPGPALSPGRGSPEPVRQLDSDLPQFAPPQGDVEERAPSRGNRHRDDRPRTQGQSPQARRSRPGRVGLESRRPDRPHLGTDLQSGGRVSSRKPRHAGPGREQTDPRGGSAAPAARVVAEELRAQLVAIRPGASPFGCMPSIDHLTSHFCLRPRGTSAKAGVRASCGRPTTGLAA